MITYNQIIIIKKDDENYAFTYDDDNNLLYQEVGKNNQIYFSSNPNEGGNIYDDWIEVDMRGLDEPYKEMVETAIQKLKQ